MKPGRKKSRREETAAESPGSDAKGSDTTGDTTVSDNRNNPEGIDGIRALQLMGGVLVVLLLVWFVLHSVLHIL